MSYRRISCSSPIQMESVLANLQEIFSHVEFVGYDGSELTVAYIA